MKLTLTRAGRANNRTAETRAVLVAALAVEDALRVAAMKTDPTLRRAVDRAVNRARLLASGRSDPLRLSDTVALAGFTSPRGQAIQGFSTRPEVIDSFEATLRHGMNVAKIRAGSSHSRITNTLEGPDYFVRAFQPELWTPGDHGSFILHPHADMFLYVGAARTDLVRHENDVQEGDGLLGPCPRDSARAFHWAQAVYALHAIEVGLETSLQPDALTTPRGYELGKA